MEESWDMLVGVLLWWYFFIWLLKGSHLGNSLRWLGCTGVAVRKAMSLSGAVSWQMQQPTKPKNKLFNLQFNSYQVISFFMFMSK